MTQRGEGPDGWIGVALVALVVELFIVLFVLWVVHRWVVK